MDFTGRHVIITGASSGIGLATARRVATLGGQVTLIARRGDVLSDACQQIGARAAFFTADVGDQAQLIAALDGAIAHHGPVDGLFLNAGAAFESVMRVNVFSLFWAVRHLLPAMTQRGRGAILITGSLASVRGMVGNLGYLASKHAALGIARAIAMEVAPSGVRCNCIHPGFIDTPMLAGVPADFKAKMAARTPQGRVGTADEAANVASFLLSDDASHVTAQELAVDGGLLGTLVM
jgi:NAD(P)-dependent dehydrogenase (short-subunit alcohol dehydrogenase family)